MNALRTSTRSLLGVSARRMPNHRRHASTLFSGWTRHATTENMTVMEKFKEFCPVEAYPLITFATGMCTYGVVTGLNALKKGGEIEELRLSPTHWGKTHRKEVWED